MAAKTGGVGLAFEADVVEEFPGGVRRRGRGGEGCQRCLPRS